MHFRSGALKGSVNTQALFRLMVAGQRGAHTLNVLVSVEEVCNTRRGTAATQSKFAYDLIYPS